MDSRVPHYYDLMNPLIRAMKALGGSGSNDEVLNQVIADLHISDEIADILHSERSNMTEFAYQLAWAKTYLFSRFSRHTFLINHTPRVIMDTTILK